MLVLAIRGPIERADLPGLFARACTVLGAGDRPGGGEREILLCDVSGIAADAVAVDALSRLALAAKRHRRKVCLHGASHELRELLTFMGLEAVLPARG